MGKKVSARIKNKVKVRFVRAISTLEKSLARYDHDKPFRHNKKK